MKQEPINYLRTVIDITSHERSLTVDQVWQKLIDWQGQSEWMLATKVWSEPHETGEGIGTKIYAFTGPRAGKYSSRSMWRFLGILDEMVVSIWQSPNFCEVQHVGKIIKGSGEFRLEAISGGVRFHWLEIIDAPKPILFLIRPGILFGVKLSLRRFRKACVAA